MSAREVIVRGTPISLQGSTRSRGEWRARVAAAAMDTVPEEDRFEVGFVDSIAVWLVYFHFGEMRGDLDNIAKPILDALIGPVWSNDALIARLTLCRVRLGALAAAPLRNPSEALQLAIERAMVDEADFVYIRAEPYAWAGEVL